MYGGAVDDDLDLVGEEVVAATLEAHVDHRVAAGVHRLLLEPAERELARVVPRLGELGQLGHHAVAPAAAAPREVLPADLVDGRAHDLADRADLVEVGEREVRDAQPGRERLLAARELADPLLGAERDAATGDARDVLLAARYGGIVLVVGTTAAQPVEKAHQLTSRSSAARASADSAARACRSMASARTHSSTPSGSVLIVTSRTALAREHCTR